MDGALVWELVLAATRLPRPAVPLAAGVIAAEGDALLPMPDRAPLLHLLAAFGDVSPTPASMALVDVRRAMDEGQANPQSTAGWQTIRALHLDAHAEQALMFVALVRSIVVRS